MPKYLVTVEQIETVAYTVEERGVVAAADRALSDFWGDNYVEGTVRSTRTVTTVQEVK